MPRVFTHLRIMSVCNAKVIQNLSQDVQFAKQAHGRLNCNEVVNFLYICIPHLVRFVCKCVGLENVFGIFAENTEPVSIFCCAQATSPFQVVWSNNCTRMTFSSRGISVFLWSLLLATAPAIFFAFTTEPLGKVLILNTEVLSAARLLLGASIFIFWRLHAFFWHIRRSIIARFGSVSRGWARPQKHMKQY